MHPSFRLSNVHLNFVHFHPFPFHPFNCLESRCPEGWIAGPRKFENCYFIPPSPQTNNFGSYWSSEDMCKKTNVGKGFVIYEM